MGKGPFPWTESHADRISQAYRDRLLIGPGMVVNACAFAEDAALQAEVRKAYPNPVKRNAANTLQRSSLVRSLQGEEDVGPAGGAISQGVSDAYIGLQKFSKTAHRSINSSIARVLTEDLNIDLPELKFEYQPHENEGLQVDCWYQRDDRPETLEFTHRLADELSPASISSYCLGKIRDYARDYGLI